MFFRCVKKLPILFLTVILLSSFQGCTDNAFQQTETATLGTTTTAGTEAILSSAIATETPPAETSKKTESTTTESITTSESATTESITATEPTTTTDATVIGSMTVHFIDVGQGDSILIQQGNASILIDAGGNAKGSQVVSYLEEQGITRLDYVIGTHPHEDHIGGMDEVIQSFDIGKVILPNASNTTQTFEDVLLAIQNKGLKVTKAVPGTEYNLNKATITILGPVLSSFDDLNDASVVCKIVFGETAFLFEGDAEEASERGMISNWFDLRANVLKIGHHGSSSSTCDSFLKAVAPQYAVISVGLDSQYGHPTQDTLNKLREAGIEVFRTDLSGNIIAVSDGKSISFSAEPDYGSPGVTEPAETTVKPTTQATEGQGTIVYITEAGTKYHLDGCRYLSKSKIAIVKDDAIQQNYEPCSVCDP